MRLNPYHPERFWNHLGRAQFTARAYADAIAVLQPHHRAGPHAPRLPGGRRRRRWATTPPRRRMRARCWPREPAFSVETLSRHAALQAGRRPRALPRGAAQGRSAGLRVTALSGQSNRIRTTAAPFSSPGTGEEQPIATALRGERDSTSKVPGLVDAEVPDRHEVDVSLESSRSGTYIASRDESSRSRTGRQVE